MSVAVTPAGPVFAPARRQDVLVYRLHQILAETATEVRLVLADSGAPRLTVTFPSAAVRIVEGGRGVAIPRWLAIENGLGLPTTEVRG